MIESWSKPYRPQFKIEKSFMPYAQCSQSIFVLVKPAIPERYKYLFVFFAKPKCIYADMSSVFTCPHSNWGTTYYHSMSHDFKEYHEYIEIKYVLILLLFKEKQKKIIQKSV